MNTDASLTGTEERTGNPSRTWERWLLWLGAPVCVLGLVASGTAAQWRGGRFVELLVLALASLALAGLLRRVLRWRLASGLALVWLLATAFFGGVLPGLATILFAAAATGAGSLVVRNGPLALRAACGLVLAAGVLGWLLPLPVHYRFAYLALCALAIALRWRALMVVAREAAAAWGDAVDAAPRTAAFALIALGLAGTATWIPTMQADDLVYHLRLPWQLATGHRYPLEPGLHIWSMAPWAADVLQAVPHVIAGAEARGSLNALWIAITAAGAWHLATALGGAPRAAWLAVALYASLPLTAALAGGMQTEPPSAALLVWLVVLLLDMKRQDTRLSWIAAVLLGGLLALKLASAAMALLLLPWLAWTCRRSSSGAMLGGLVTALAIAGSSYAYAGVVAGNPFLPLFNGWFRSPHYAPANFDDARWHAGFDAALPWNLTFHTERYLEAFAGGGGFLLVALAGAWLLALLARRTRWVAILATALLVVVLLPMQYLRYAFPAFVLMAPALSVAAFRVHPQRAAWLLAGVCVLNLAFQANGFWLLRVGMVKMAILEAGRDAPLFRMHTPERNLIAAIRRSAHGNVLALDAERPYVAELGVRGRSISHYDRSLQSAARVAEADAGGSAWADLLRHEAITDVLLRPASTTSAQRLALARLGATRERADGGTEWWRIPAEPAR